jgi:hypothetical protein
MGQPVKKIKTKLKSVTGFFIFPAFHWLREGSHSQLENVYSVARPDHLGIGIDLEGWNHAPLKYPNLNS